MQQPKIVIVLRGGCVLAVYAPAAFTGPSPKNQTIEIVDCDDLSETLSRESVAETVDETAAGLSRVY